MNGHRIALQFVGSGDAFGSGGRLQTCISIHAADTRLLIDCGATALAGMNKLAIDPSSVDAIALTHLHGDHFGGIPFFILDAQFAKRERPLTIAGPKGMPLRVQTAMEVLFPGSWTTRRRFDVLFREYEPRIPIDVAGFAVRAFPVIHESGSPSYALRVERNGASIAYSGDTEWTDELIAVADGTDVFVCEAYFFEKHVKYHLDYATLRERRSLLRCERIVLTHVSADLLHRAADVSDIVATDGMTLYV